MSAEFLVRNDDRCFKTSFSLTSMKAKCVSTRLLRKVSQVFLDLGLIWPANFGAMFAKNIEFIAYFLLIFYYFRIHANFVKCFSFNVRFTDYDRYGLPCFLYIAFALGK